MNFHVPLPDDDDRVHLAPTHHHFATTQSASPVHFKHPGTQPVDPSLGVGGPGGGLTTSPRPSHPDGSVTGSFFSETPRSVRTPSTPSNSIIHRSPSVQRQSLTGFHPSDRALPSRDVSDELIDDAYAAFILYCNPYFPPTIDTSELKRTFRQPPRSDGKQFSIWHLYELVKRFEEKDIKTWVELALELGVEKPVLDKGQSSQKVQQYTVRLKRWMHAMHVDAFFDYLRGAPKEYYTHIPPLHNPYPEEGRDGVPAEEDLAIRALDPSKKPKRGRRKADEMEGEVGRSISRDPKHLRIYGIVDFTSPSAFVAPNSAYPQEFIEADPWTAASSITPANLVPSKGPTPGSAHSASLFRWQVHNNAETTPLTPHPMSAFTPASAHPDSAWADEPQSAITPRGKTRRRHGPMVSSAWSSTAGTSNGKLRGRPPSNRTFRDGPYSTFPVKPSVSVSDSGRTPTSTTTPMYPPLLIPQAFTAQGGAESPVPQSSTSNEAPTSAKRERLSLQVPKRPSGPVRLITPPSTNAQATPTPTVLVNGEDRERVMVDPPRRGSVFFGDSSGDEHGGAFTLAPPQPAQTQHVFTQSYARQQMLENPVSQYASTGESRVPQESLKRALAHHLLRANLTGRKRKRLRGAEAKCLASAILQRVGDQSSGQAATWLGLAGEIGMSDASSSIASDTKKISINRFRVDDDGYDSPIDDDDYDEDDLRDGLDGLQGEASLARDKRRIKETFDVSWSITMGGISGDFQIRGLVISDNDGPDEGSSDGPSSHKDSLPDAPADWRDKYVKAQLELRSKEEEVKRLREKILDAVL